MNSGEFIVFVLVLVLGAMLEVAGALIGMNGANLPNYALPSAANEATNGIRSLLSLGLVIFGFSIIAGDVVWLLRASRSRLGQRREL